MERRFAGLADRLQGWFPQARVEHIGSSAIPGAHSKGDLDIALIVAAEALEACVARLSAQGYQEKRGTLRTPALCMLEWQEPGQDHALQVVAEGSEFMGLFLTFRDRLRASPPLLAAYNRLKMASAPLGEQGYRAAKAGFIEKVLGETA